MKRPLQLLATASLFAFLLGAPRAHGGEPTVPSFSRLPAGKLSSPPKKSPLHVGARERAPGVFVVAVPWPAGVPVAHRNVSIVGDAPSAKNHQAPRVRNAACLSQLSPAMSKHAGAGTESAGATWPAESSSEANAYFRSSTNPASGVTAVHVERVVETGATTASLEWTDAWVDPDTGGSRLIAKGSLPLELVRSSSLDLKVYAARTSSDAEPTSLQFVVSRSGERSAVIEQEAMTVLRQDGVSSTASGCGHLRIALAVKPGGNSASVLAPVVLRSLTHEEKPKTEGEEEEFRVRDVQLQLSVSQASRDPEPVLSASFGWAGREQVRRVSPQDE